MNNAGGTEQVFETICHRHCSKNASLSLAPGPKLVRPFAVAWPLSRRGGTGALAGGAELAVPGTRMVRQCLARAWLFCMQCN